MRFTDLFIRRPVLAVTISLMMVLFGLEALRGMAIREYPKVTNTVITVTTNYYGASADVIQGFITQPVEQAIAQAENIDYMTSSSQLGRSTITVNMRLNTNPNAALADVLAKVNSVRSQLPKEADDPSITSSTGSNTSILYIAFSSAVLNSSQLTDYLERVIKPQLFTVPGVAKVNLYGGTQFAMRIWLDPLKMGAYNLSSSQVMSVLQSNNYQSAPGQATGYFVLYNAEADTQVNSTQQLEDLIVASHDGAVIRVRDIAKVTLEKNHDQYRALANGKEAVIVAVDSSPSANPLDIAANVRKLLPDFQHNLPNTMSMKLLYDSTQAINESIKEVLKTIVEAAAIVLVVIALFLGSMRAVVIPIITIPLSLVGVVMLMQMFGFSINLITLLAMVLAIGLVVDDAIVVVENVDRHIKAGETPFRAAIIGTREIASPVITMTITLAAVYTPIALMGGITGSIFKEFALTLAGAVFISGVIALTLSPMMCAVMLKPHINPNRFERGVENTLNSVTAVYSRILDKVMTRRPVIIVFGVIVLAVMPLLFKLIPAELAPSEDRGAYLMMAKAPNTANLDYIQNNMAAVGETLMKDPAMSTNLALAGIPNSNQGLGIAILKPWSEREKAPLVVARTNAALQNMPGVAISSFQFPELPGAGGGLPLQLVITTPNEFRSLFEVASDALAKIKTNHQFVYTDLDLAFDSATMRIKINRDKAGAYGVTMQDIGATLSAMMGDGNVNRVSLNGRSYEVIPQVERQFRLNPESLKHYYVQAANGQSVPLNNLVSVELKSEIRSLPHYNQLNSATIGIVPIMPMGDAVQWLEDNVVSELPLGYQHDYMGEARQYVQEGNALMYTFMLALCVIFLVLAAQFESWRDPLVIMMSVPLAISGALVALAWGLSTMNIYTEVGIITLVGLISKHGILICEVAREQQLLKGMSKMDAVKIAARVRLRPILMTTAAMVTGLLPLLGAMGAGALSRFSIGIVIVAGLTIGTFFTLFVLPVIYTFVGKTHKPLQEFDESVAPLALHDHD